MSDCAACADPQGDGTCAACCQEGVASDMAHMAARLRAISAMLAWDARRELDAWANECEKAEREAVEAVRELRNDEGWTP